MIIHEGGGQGGIKMINGRMLKIIHYLYSNKDTTYKDISKDLDIKERLIRYDIEKINDFLEIQKLPLIERLPKGRLLFSDTLSLDDFEQGHEFIFTQNDVRKAVRKRTYPTSI